jgi:hypothetical protein
LGLWSPVAPIQRQPLLVAPIQSQPLLWHLSSVNHSCGTYPESTTPCGTYPESTTPVAPTQRQPLLTHACILALFRETETTRLPRLWASPPLGFLASGLPRFWASLSLRPLQAARTCTSVHATRMQPGRAHVHERACTEDAARPLACHWPRIHMPAHRLPVLLRGGQAPSPLGFLALARMPRPHMPAHRPPASRSLQPLAVRATGTRRGVRAPPARSHTHWSQVERGVAGVRVG